MELELISGRFTPKEAEQVLTDIFHAKIDYHQRKIGMPYLTEKDVQHAEKEYRCWERLYKALYSGSERVEKRLLTFMRM